MCGEYLKEIIKAASSDDKIQFVGNHNNSNYNTINSSFIHDNEPSKATLKRVDEIFRRLPLSSSSPQQGNDDPILDALENVMRMMMMSEKAGPFSRQLGLETLVTLTDPTKTGLSGATTVAKAILLGRFDPKNSNNTGNNSSAVQTDFSQVQMHILYLALLGRWYNAPAAGGGCGGELESDNNKLHYTTQLALQILANAARLVQEPSVLDSLLDVAVQLTGQSMILNLQHQINWNSSNGRPHSAYLATIILTQFCHHMTNAATDLVAGFHSVENFKRCSHAALEMEIGKLFHVLGEAS